MANLRQTLKNTAYLQSSLTILLFFASLQIRGLG